jgi:glycosyltransferase involved in cell wall biosynthesis
VKGLHETTIDAGILFPYQDVDALVNEIQHLMADTDYYKMIADRCMRRAEEYDISKTAKGYLEVYDRLAK